MGRSLARGAVRWVRQEQMHLTLRFLGETAVTQLPALQDQLTQLTSQHPPFGLQLGEIGAFPSRKRPRVVWAGLAGDVASLRTLHGDLSARLAALGWPEEKRPFSPHITLGRVKDAKQSKQLNWDVDLAKVVVEVTAVELVQSELRPSGPIYTVRHSAQLIR